MAWLYCRAMRKPWKLVLPATLLAATLLGCGGGGSTSVAEYEAAIVETRDRADSALARIPEAKSEDDFLDRLDEAGEVIEAEAGDLDDVGAPERFEDETERLIRHLRELGAALQGTAEQARQTGFDKLLSQASGLNFESWDKVNAILRTLRQQGIEVRPLARH